MTDAGRKGMPGAGLKVPVGFTEFACECGNAMVTNDEYMIDAWNEWHEAGAFLAGKWHRPTSIRVLRLDDGAPE